MADRRVQCPVIDDVQPTEQEINAFRILPETGSAYFLDFIHYSPADQRAVVVSRIRVQEDALASIRERLSSDLLEAPDMGVSIIWPKNTVVN